MMLDMLLALLPSAALSIVYWGVDALRVMALAVAVSIFSEAVCCRLMERKSSIDDWIFNIRPFYEARKRVVVVLQLFFIQYK